MEITIVGGGTAGWLSAINLIKRTTDAIKVNLIESEVVNTVGVGEATLISLPKMLKRLELDEVEFISRCNASYKLGIRFDNWLRGENNFYLHMFTEGGGDSFKGIPLVEYWLSLRKGGTTYEASSYNHFCNNLCKALYANRSPRKVDKFGELKTLHPYAYHLDASLFANYLKEKSLECGVNYIVGDVETASFCDDGSIKDLVLSDKTVVQGDLFIDCTGFNAVLINRLLKVPFQDFSRLLLCDRAVAVKVDYPKENFIPNYTRATAANNGWIWDIPLFDRRGVGYVYSSEFGDESLVIEELQRYLGEANVAGGTESSFPMRTGKSEKFWYKNCVAIGLSGGFIEPLESSGIGLIEVGINKLISIIGGGDLNVEKSEIYNRDLDNIYNETLTYVLLHYHLSLRKEPFWVAARNLEIPDTLKVLLDSSKIKWPDKIDNLDIFSLNSYYSIFDGMEFYPEISKRFSDKEKKEVCSFFYSHQKKVNSELLQLKSHREFLKKLREIYAVGTFSEDWQKNVFLQVFECQIDQNFSAKLISFAEHCFALTKKGEFHFSEVHKNGDLPKFDSFFKNSLANSLKDFVTNNSKVFEDKIAVSATDSGYSLVRDFELDKFILELNREIDCIVIWVIDAGKLRRSSKVSNGDQFILVNNRESVIRLKELFNEVAGIVVVTTLIFN